MPSDETEEKKAKKVGRGSAKREREAEQDGGDVHVAHVDTRKKEKEDPIGEYAKIRHFLHFKKDLARK